MTTELSLKKASGKSLVRKCHACGGVMESVNELHRCPHCKKAFLPHNYFGKIHAKNSQEYEQLFDNVDELHEDDLIKGLFVIW